MKKRIGIGIGIFLIILMIMSIITNYIDSARVTTGHEPKYCIKIVNYDGSKVTYWGLGYKVIRYVGVSPKEPYESNIGVKMGSWFMKYDKPSNIIHNYEPFTKNTKKDVSLLVKEGTLTNTGAIFILKNNSDKIFEYDSPYTIETKKHEKWHKIEVDVTWNLPIYILKASETKEININWENGYGKLEKGIYRLIKEIKYRNSEGEYECFSISTEFTIE